MKSIRLGCGAAMCAISLLLAPAIATAAPAWTADKIQGATASICADPVTGVTYACSIGADSGPVTGSTTPNSSSHAAGTSVGGLFSVPVARTNSGSGILTSVNWMSAGGSTGTLVIRIWAKNPVNTTCTDQTAYAGSAVDDAFLVTPPFSITPSAPAVTTGDAKTYAAQTGLSLDYKNLDTPAGQNLYVCAVTVSTDTADESAKVTVTLSGPQN